MRGYGAAALKAERRAKEQSGMGMSCFEATVGAVEGERV
ncbi:hypothetical protein AG0111_0g7334 [Alternaria gaisen]|jgi:hypothetical protein|uniref:Uncharacterized protein n=1 Tax=Alternaria gaisen TaxID=167740 RepID=A0ACB6FHJ5_9PLEO|nr:hypothetical protein AG0111_0g7334 [Alternaria gaisen]